MSERPSPRGAGDLGDRQRRRRFLALTAAAPALVGLSARADGAPSPALDRAPAADRDVKAFGAVGDGAADDTAAIQAALDDAARHGGGTVRIPAGRFSTRTLTIDSKVHLAGAGIEATVLQLRAGTDGDLIRSHQFAALSGTNRNVGPYNFSIRDLTLDGNRSRNARGCGLRLYAFGYLLSDLRIRQVRRGRPLLRVEHRGPGVERRRPGDPRRLDGSPGRQPQGPSLRRGGIRFRGPHDSQFVNCVVYDTTTIGIHVAGDDRTSATGCQFVNCHVWGAHSYAWKIEAGFVTLDTCVAEWARLAQVHLNSGDATIIAGRFFGHSKHRHVGIEIGTPERPRLRLADRRADVGPDRRGVQVQRTRGARARSRP